MLERRGRWDIKSSFFVERKKCTTFVSDFADRPVLRPRSRSPAMRFSLPLANLVLAFSGLALAAPHARRENNGTAQPYTGDITIHSSCNATERRQLRKAIDDTYNIANVARKRAYFLICLLGVRQLTSRCVQISSKRVLTTRCTRSTLATATTWLLSEYICYFQCQSASAKGNCTQAYDSLIFTNKSGVVFRCDDVDGKYVATVFLYMHALTALAAAIKMAGLVIGADLMRQARR